MFGQIILAMPAIAIASCFTLVGIVIAVCSTSSVAEQSGFQTRERRPVNVTAFALRTPLSGSTGFKDPAKRARKHGK